MTKTINKIDSQKENIMAEITQLGARYLRAKRKLFDTYYSELNAPQREAVFTANGALLVLSHVISASQSRDHRMINT